MFRFLPLLPLLAACALSGCQSLPIHNPFKSQTTTTVAEPAPVQLLKPIAEGQLASFPDVPVPATHQIELDKSLVFTSPNQTIGKLTLSGKGDAPSVFYFYQSTMTHKGWSLVNGFQTNTSTLYFAKPGRFVAVLIESTGRNSSRVTLNIGPE